MAPDGFGLPTQSVVPTDYLNAAFPYYSLPPNIALQLANLQFGAGLDAQSQNNALSMQLAQGAASNRLADNIGSRLALRGLGPVPGFGSAFQGGFGVSPMQVPNIGNLFQNLFGQTQNALTPRPLNSIDALKAMLGGDNATGQAILRNSAGLSSGVIPGPFGSFPYNPTNPYGSPYYGAAGGGWGTPTGGYSPYNPASGVDTRISYPRAGSRPPSSGGFDPTSGGYYQTQGFARGGAIPFGQSGIVGEVGPEVVTSTGQGTQVTPLRGQYQFGTSYGTRDPAGGIGSFGIAPGSSPIEVLNRTGTPTTKTPLGYGGSYGTRDPVQTRPPYMNEFPTGSGGTYGRTPFPGQGTAYPTANSPFADILKLAFGQGKFGPSSFSDPALGIPSFGAPRSTLNQFYQGDPYSRDAQNYLYSLFGYDPSMLNYERQFFTPGARQFQSRGFGY